MLARKRARSRSPTTTSMSMLLDKTTHLEPVHHGGVVCHGSAPSTSSCNLARLSVRDRVRRGMSNFKNKLIIHHKESETSDKVEDAAQDSSVVISREAGPHLNMVQAMVYSTMTRADLHRHLRLSALPESMLDDIREDSVTHWSCKTTQTAPITPTEQNNANSIDRHSAPGLDQGPSTMRRKNSTLDLHYRVSKRIKQALSEPTIVRRVQPKPRAALHVFPPGKQYRHEENSSSSPLTERDGLHSSRGNKHYSTPATSDVTTLSPVSTRHYSIQDRDGSDAFNSNTCSPDHIGFVQSKPCLSIKTVEVTAAAKIYLETHFNALMNEEQPRNIRQRRLEQQMQLLQLSEHQCQRACELLRQYETHQLRRIRTVQNWYGDRAGDQRANLAGFEIIKVLGKGSFGVVRLVKERPSENPQMPDIASMANLIKQAAMTNVPICTRLKVDLLRRRQQVYAMKVIRKSEMIRSCQEGHLRAERDFLVAAEGSRWVIPLLAAFQDDKFLYLVMDYCIGGDFLGLLIRRDILCEEVTRWYVAEMILCIEEAHRMKWIHRDVKPDNFLIGADGHLKISDFGLAFDGGWRHDQKYFHKQRHGLLEKLGLHIEGDALDQREQQETENSRRLADVTRTTFKRKREPSSLDECSLGEPLLDWRNRTQQRQLAKSVVGTSQYMAPEIIRGDAYDGRCD